ncbi:helix-turn-helix transcriptional regulator [Paenibacillus sp. GYB003]|uniref:helix-turn-helix transcriptional regulator n=1 Tax=Paenibacillus sp. GYB003 TaxID=2994392 RepID=UPI002F96ABA4
MGNMHRIGWFDQQIREGGYPNSKRLAEQFEISRRQAQRDIEYMEDSLRAPLVYVAGKRGYCYGDKTYALPHLYMTEEEKRVLNYLAHRYRGYQYDNAASVARIADLLERFADGETAAGCRLPVFETNPRLLQNVELLSQAIRGRLVVVMTYRDEDGETAGMRIWPLKLVSRYNADYAIAYCERLREERKFRLDGIREAVVTAEPFDYAGEETDRWGEPAPGKKPFTARLRLAQPPGNGAWNGFPARLAGDSVYEISFYDADSFVRHLLVAEWERLLSPKWLRTMLRDKCERALARLNGDDAAT